MKNKKMTLLLLWLSFYGFVALAAQDSTFQKVLNQHWGYAETTNMELPHLICQKGYGIIFLEAGRGLLSVSVHFESARGAKLVFGGGTPFTYEVMENANSPHPEWELKVVYDDFYFWNLDNFDKGEWAQKTSDFDRSLLDEVARSFSNQEATYRVQHHSKYLVFEGFVQNAESGFTYFDSDLVREDDN